jgi:D-glycero-D-manno-heptose 1,7-bisphosphate phosphatase
VSSLAAAFLDRDGTINVKAPEGDYITSPDELTMLPGAGAAVARLNAAGIPVVVVTNQRGVALGRMTSDDVAAVHRRLDELLAADDAHVDAYFFCPHDKAACDCRKPQIGMFEQAASRLGLEGFTGTAMVGDAASDVEAGKRIGARTVQIRHDGATADERADHVVGSLTEAVEWLLDA